MNSEELNKMPVKEVDSFNQTDGSFTHKPVIREGFDRPKHEVDSSSGHLNRFGEQNPRAVLGRLDEPAGTEHFRHDPDYSWSKDMRSESYSEKNKDLGTDEDRRDDEFVLTQIEDAFSKRNDIDVTNVSVKVENGVVFLSGEVPSENEKLLLDRILSEIYGVTGLMNTVSIRIERENSRGIIGRIADLSGPVKGLH